MQHQALRYGKPLLLSVAPVSSGCGAMTGHGSGNCSPKHVSVATARSEQPKQLVRVEGHYLRKNGIPYSAEAVVTEYFDRVTQPNGDVYLVVTMTVEDPMYLSQPYMTSTSFRKQADAARWNPAPCTSR